MIRITMVLLFIFSSCIDDLKEDIEDDLVDSFIDSKCSEACENTVSVCEEEYPDISFDDCVSECKADVEIQNHINCIIQALSCQTAIKCVGD